MTHHLRRPLLLLSLAALAGSLVAVSGTARSQTPPQGSLTIPNPCGTDLLPTEVCEQATITTPTTNQALTLQGRRTGFTSTTPVTGVARRNSYAYVYVVRGDDLSLVNSVPYQPEADDVGNFNVNVAFPSNPDGVARRYCVAAYYRRDTTEITNPDSFYQATGAPPICVAVTVPVPPDYANCDTTFDMTTLLETGLPGTFGVNMIDSGFGNDRDANGNPWVFTLTSAADPETERCQLCDWENPDTGDPLYFCIERPSGFDPLIFLSSDAPVTVDVSALPTSGILTGWSSAGIIPGGWRMAVSPESSLQPLQYTFARRLPLGAPSASGWSIPSEELAPFLRTLVTELGYPADEVRSFLEIEVGPRLLTSPALEVSLLTPEETASIIDLRITPTPASVERLFVRITPTSAVREMPAPDLAPFRHHDVAGLQVREYAVL